MAFLLNAQENQMDSSGKRHGLWKGYHEKTKKLRYEGNFDHGKELGVFKYYADNKENTLMATRDFSQGDGSCYTVFYDTKKFKVSEGNLVNKKPEGLWKYYHLNSDKVMTLENYKNGKLNGERYVYYTNGQIAEKAFYKNDRREGKYYKYAENGNLIEESIYKNGELHGKASFYDGEGNLLVLGEYKKNVKVGIWETYENGKLVKKETAAEFSGKTFKLDNPNELEYKEELKEEKK
ncbi:MAG: hypothetical protein IE891_06125 [Flavobacteriaceae bacterium]|nr:hypothetical protein [Flavobacteriaceae bacterium]